MGLQSFFRSRLEADREEILRYCERGALDWIARSALLAVACSFYTYVLDDAFYLIWAAIFVIVASADFLSARALVRDLNMRTYATWLATDFADTVLSILLFTHLWIQPDPMLKAVALVFACGSLLFILTERVKVATLAISDTVYFQLYMIFAWVWLLMTGEGRGSGLIFVLVLIGLQVYHFLMIRQVLGNIAEINTARRRSQQAQRLEAVGRLTGGIAHDFNNLLTVIQGNLELYNELDDPGERRTVIAESREAAERAATLTSQLLAFSRHLPLQVADVNLRNYFTNSLPLIQRTLPATISVESEFLGEDLIVRTDQNILTNAIINLVLNASAAMEGKGVIRVVTGPVSTETYAGTGLAEGRYLKIAVQDHGPGFDASVIDRVFEPYFTTRQVGEGSGLGLSMVRGFAEQSKGTAIARNRSTGGASVELILPAANSPL